MRYFFVAVVLAFTDAGVITNDPTCITIRNINYEKEVLKTGVQSPYQLAIDHDSNTLFFSYTARTDEMFKIAYLSLKTGEYGIVTGIHGGFATAVNSKGHIVYLGGEDGLYRFNYDSKTAINLHIMDKANVWQMFYKDGLYFTTYPEEKAYLYKGDDVDEVPAVKNIRAMVIAVTKNDDILYSNSTGMFIYDQLKNQTTQLNDYIVNGFTSDIDGHIYFSTARGIYFFNEKINQIEDVVSIGNIYGVTIESDGNIIYAAEESIIRLKPTKKVCFDEKLYTKNTVEQDQKE